MKMAQDTKLNVHDIIWHFSVTDPRLHTKGFTVYKVSCQSFPINAPEILTEIVCWKRYNDFKTLHKSLMTLHKTQHISDPFPEFAKPRLFGRFAEGVIEKRRQSTIDLLNFISTQPHLYKSSVFKDFLEEGRIQSDFNKRGSFLTSRSSNLSIISSGLKVERNSKPDLVQACSTVDYNEQLKFAENTLPVGNIESITIAQTVSIRQENSPVKNNKAQQTMLEGTWKFPQVADAISLDSSTGDEIIDTDDESFMTCSLPDADLTYFDQQINHDYTMSIAGDSSRNISRNASWLQEGLNICAVMGSDSEFYQGKAAQHESLTTSVREFSRGYKEITLDTESTATKAPETAIFLVGSLQTDLSTITSNIKTGTSKHLEDLDSSRRISQSSGSSKAECGRGDLDLSAELQKRSSSFGSGVVTSSQRSSSGTSSSSLSVGSDSSENPEKALDRKPTDKFISRSLLKHLASIKPVFSRPRSVTEQSVSTMSLGGKDDYIYRAANQICKAQNSEANGDYEVAFAYYKSGVGILLHGVQGDTNKFRRDAVRRKTAKYLMKAEDLFNRHLAHENVGEMRWGTDSFLSPSLDPSFAFIRGSAKELRNFQVLATIDRVILVQHKVTDETFVIKSIPKSTLDIGSTQSILPTSCPYMVSLHRFFETEDSVFLLLQYASGGKLWTYIEEYLNNSNNNRGIEQDAMKTDNKLVNSETRPATSQHEDVEQDNIKLDYVLKEKDTSISHVYQSYEDNVKTYTESSKSADTFSFPVVGNEISESYPEGDFILTSSRSESFDVDNNEVIACGSDGPDILNISDLSDVPTSSSHKSLPLYRRLSCLSDDYAAVSEQDSSVISPILLPEENSFQSLLQENKASSEAFSINSIDSEDTQHNLSFLVKNINIPKNNDCTSSPAFPTSNQIISSGLFPVVNDETLSVINENQTSMDGDLSTNATHDLDTNFNADDLIRKSKELLTQVEKVLSETSDTPADSGNNFNDDHIESKQSPYNSHESSEEHLENELNKSLVSRASHEHNDNNYDSGLPDKQFWSPAQNYLDAAKFINDSNTTNTDNKSQNALIQKRSSFSQPGESESSIINVILENESQKHNHLVESNNTSQSNKTNTARRLSVSRMNYRGMTRSVSFDCDFRSPSRNRTKTASYLFEHIDSTNVDSSRIPETFIKKWMAQMVTAVSRLHSLGVVCRDLKPSNILLGDGGQVYLTYFCKLGDTDQEPDWDAKKNLYAAPEVGSVHKYARSCDWWSIGAVLYELVVGRNLRECHPGGINSHTCLHIPPFVSNETRGLLEGLLRHNPNERLGSGMAGSEEIKAHPFFTGVDWRALEYS